MKSSFLLAVFVIIGISVHAQQPGASAALKKYEFLIGDWVGEGGGQPGLGKGYFSFKPDLDGRILVRKNHTEFAATPQKAAFTHEDLLVIYADQPGDVSKAILMDNEDHTIHYNVTVADDGKSIIFTSVATTGMPGFRLSYIKLDGNSVDIKFEMAPPNNPDAFSLYLEGKAHRKWFYTMPLDMEDIIGDMTDLMEFRDLAEHESWNWPEL